MFKTKTASAHQRISQLAARPDVHQAFQWLHLQDLRLRQWQMEAIAIPSPPFGERARAEWLCAEFTRLGLSNVHIDGEGNALAELSASDADQNSACVLLSAHIDTVFPAGTPCAPREDGVRILGPGACDNAAGITVLLAMAAALTHAGITPRQTILFAGNVGEEGEGNLRGMMHLYTRSPYRARIAACIAPDGAGIAPVVAQGLGSRRFRITLTGPGGHSWTDNGVVNPVVVLCRALSAIAEIPLPPVTSLNACLIEGGTAINAIPQSASAQLDLRSTGPEQILWGEMMIYRAIEDTVIAANEVGFGEIQFRVDVIGDRPAASMDEDAPILQTIRAVDRHLGIRTEMRVGSTDANVPLSLGRQAVSLGAGGSAGGIHTLQEWYDPTGRELALKRILLALLDLSESAVW
jgi:tripeptide aminopeptidase